MWATSHGMACDEDPADRARFSLAITVPAGMQGAPAPSFFFGFAAGEFTETAARVGRNEFRFLGERHDAAQFATIRWIDPWQ